MSKNFNYPDDYRASMLIQYGRRLRELSHLTEEEKDTLNFLIEDLIEIDRLSDEAYNTFATDMNNIRNKHTERVNNIKMEEIQMPALPRQPSLGRKKEFVEMDPYEKITFVLKKFISSIEGPRSEDHEWMKQFLELNKSYLSAPQMELYERYVVPPNATAVEMNEEIKQNIPSKQYRGPNVDYDDPEFKNIFKKYISKIEGDDIHSDEFNTISEIIDRNKSRFTGLEKIRYENYKNMLERRKNISYPKLPSSSRASASAQPRSPPMIRRRPIQLISGGEQGSGREKGYARNLFS